MPPASPEMLFSSLCDRLLLDRGVSEARMFGSRGLKISDRVFAMLVRGRLVVKLPAPRVAALVAAGAGERFDPGHGRTTKEWISVESRSDDHWLRLATEAKEYVAGA